jgi:hypothetical protein
VDLERASAAVDGGLAVPEVERFENLRVLPFTVWIDNQHVRRVRFCEGRGPQSALTVDLYDFGTPTNHLDWSRLPTFRSV